MERFVTCCSIICLFVFAGASCTSEKRLSKSGLAEGYYQLRQPEGDYLKVYVASAGDSITIIPLEEPQKVISTINPVFLKRSFDVDVLAIPFKFRPAVATVPRQLTADFNGNIYLGYRLDRYKSKNRQTPVGRRSEYHYNAITAGFFGGIGNSIVNPSTTQNMTTDEYNALVLTRGISVMAGVKNLTVGVGIGWDYLTDRDRAIWVYQNKPWLGLTLSLNLN